MTWTELDDRSTQLARVFGRKGLVVGDRLLVGLGNSPELVVGLVAAWKAGVTPIPMRPSLPEWERARVVEAADAALVIDGDDTEWFAEGQHESTQPLADVVAGAASGICSSGSTGTPKVILRNSPTLWEVATPSVAVVEKYRPLPRPQVVLTPGPLYHNNGLNCVNDLLAGNTIVVLSRFSPELAVDVIARHRVTGFMATTVLLQRMSQMPGIDTADLSSLAWVMQGGAHLPDWLAEHWIGLIGAERFFVCYGSSERVGVTACRGDEWLEHRGTAGTAFGGTEIRILNEDGTPTRLGEIGDVYMRPPGGAKHSYLGSATPTPTTDDGFCTVGDLGWLDDDGYLYLADRRVDLIKSGGANVFPAEVEAALSEHPAIADVVVVGVADDDWGQRVHAVVQLKAGLELDAAALIAYARTKLAPYKAPRTVRIVDAIPRTEATKVNRREVAERFGNA